MITKITQIERFWEAIFYSPDGCWYWTRVVNDNGYGFFTHLGRMVMAHRFSYEMHKGQIPTGLLVCHHCDNKRCVNPDHLFVGSNKDNTRDMMKKGRQVMWGTPSQFTITIKQVIWEAIALGFKRRDLANYFNVSVDAIYNVTRPRAKRLIHTNV